MSRLDEKKLAKLRAAGLSPEQINLVLGQVHQRKVTGSNVVLSQDEERRMLTRFQAKTYLSRTSRPMKPRIAAKLESKYGLNKNLTSKQEQDLIDYANGKGEVEE